MRNPRAFLVPVLAVLLVVLPGCSAISAFTPPDWGYFDVVQHPTGGIPATLGYYGGVGVWSPVGILLGAVLPFPADEAVWVPGEGLGTVVGLALGAPFHLVALPFGGGDDDGGGREGAASAPEVDLPR